MLTRLRAVEGLKLIQLDHANVISIAQFTDEELQTVHDLIVGQNHHRFPWVNVGVESASGALLRANSSAKMGRCADADWGDLCAEQLRRLCRAGFFPLVSLMVGLPGETDEDVRRTLAWVEALAGERLAIFPVLHAPIHGDAGVDVRELSRLHWRLIKSCYRMNFRWVPHMYWDNQTGAGVPLARRLLLQGMGHGQVLQWNALFAWHGARAKR